MAAFSHMIRFAGSDGTEYLAEIGAVANETSIQGTRIQAYGSFDDLRMRKDAIEVEVKKLLAPLPYTDIPIYCVGLNYKSHAEEAKLKVPQHPPLWTKPSASLANPGEDIPVNKFCASTLPDYEAELVFVTSRECKDITIEEAPSCILGYTVGNDLSCRLHQLPDQAGGQFYFAKAFDKFAPIGPLLVGTAIFDAMDDPKLILKVNGQTRQEAYLKTDMIFTPAQILSRMSQGTTIPAGTAVMTGTPAGVGAFMSPQTFLKDGDVVEVNITGIGTLKNRIVFS